MKTERIQPHVARASTVLKALSNERRLMVLLHLAEGEKSVGALEGLVGLSHSALSQHLARLRRGSNAQQRRSPQPIHSSLSGGAALTIIHGPGA